MPDFLIDDQQIICWVSTDWDSFAQLNDATSSISRDTVLGQRLFRFIEGDATRMFYDAAMLYTQQLKKPCVFHYRCDVPDASRTMSMQIQYQRDNGGWLFKNSILATHEMATAIDFHYSTTAAMIRCSICNRVHLDDTWHDAFVHPKLIGARESIAVDYVICPSCEFSTLVK